MAGNEKLKKTQSVLNLPLSKASGPSACKLCGMTYYAYIKQDKDIHRRYHLSFVNGVKWTAKTEVIRRIRLKAKPNEIEVEIIRADEKQAAQVTRVEKLLEFVKKELGASAASDAWRDRKKGLNSGYAFVLLIKGIAIGVCVTEPIVDVQLQGRWMIYQTQEIVPRQVNKNIIIGISRIWIAPKWRRFGLGKHLLQAVSDYLIHGLQLKPSQIAFSQPSSAGSLLAKSFNAVKHKSGELLLPVYIENA